ncbi:MAG: MFS transporter [Clostridia bacterium]|nr:MFS transporter [Clostridia bacterium]
MINSHKRVKYACYSVNISMAVVGNLPPVLFLTFQSMYGISYSLLGLLVLVNFVTQLFVDLIFSFFSHKFNIPLTVKLTPMLTIIGLLIYALTPYVFPGNVYPGLVIGTIVFSAAAGLAEVLISPVIAALPSDNPDREMSKLHSIYAWGVVGVILVSSMYLVLFGRENWQWLMLLMTVIPLASVILYAGAEIPKMSTPERVSGVLQSLKNRSLWLCVAAIFLGGAAECTMAQWASGYLEQALQIEKIWGDLFGVALFALALGLGRTMYAKVGKHIGRVLFFGAVGATLCYLTAAMTSVALLGLFACAFTGFCVSMLWPGCLIVATDRFPSGGVFIFAMMAAGGDLGASVGPQLIGIITDLALENSTLLSLAQKVSLMPEQLGMKLGMLVGMLFPLVAIFVYLFIWKTYKKAQKTDA